MINCSAQWLREAKGFASKVLEDADRLLKAVEDMDKFQWDVKEFHEAKIDACNCIMELATALEDSFMIKNLTPAKETVYADLDTRY